MSDPKKADTKLVDSPEGGIFGWCYAIFRVSDKELEMTRGLDVVVSTERVVHVVYREFQVSCRFTSPISSTASGSLSL